MREARKRRHLLYKVALFTDEDIRELRASRNIVHVIITGGVGVSGGA